MKVASLLLTLLFSSSLLSNTEIVKVQVEGIAPSERNAIDIALTEAMGRVNGKSVESEVLLNSSQKSTSDNSGTEYSSSREYQDTIKSRTKGVVDSYRLLSSTKEGSSYRVKLEVSVVKFKLSKSANRKRMAVLPLQVRGPGRRPRGGQCCRGVGFLLLRPIPFRRARRLHAGAQVLLPSQR